MTRSGVNYETIKNCRLGGGGFRGSIIGCARGDVPHEYQSGAALLSGFYRRVRADFRGGLEIFGVEERAGTKASGKVRPNCCGYGQPVPPGSAGGSFGAAL